MSEKSLGENDNIKENLNREKIERDFYFQYSKL